MRLITLILLTLPLLAQQFSINGPPTLTDVLGLTTDQAQKISALYVDYDNFLTRRSRNQTGLVMISEWGMNS